MAGGRSTKYDDKVKPKIDEVEKMASYGLTQEQIASILSIHPETLINYKQRYPEFFEAIKRGKDIANSTVVKSLFFRATGYHHTETKVFRESNKETGSIETVKVDIDKYYPPRSDRDWETKT